MMDDSILNPESLEKDEKKKKKKEEKEQERAEKDKMASERTLLAYERTLLAWLRTATSLMTFGFAIYKLLQERISKPGHYPLLEYISPKSVGLVMIGSGFIGLTLAVIRYIEVLKKYNQYSPKIYRSAVMIQAYVILMLSLLLIIGAVIGQ
jgi:putative membrane protein